LSPSGYLIFSVHGHLTSFFYKFLSFSLEVQLPASPLKILLQQATISSLSAFQPFIAKQDSILPEFIDRKYC